MNVDIYLPVRIKMTRALLLKQYRGTLRIGGHELSYCLMYSDQYEKGMVTSTLTWDDPQGIFAKVYDEISKPFTAMLRDYVITYEAKLNILKRKTPGNLDLMVSGGTPAAIKQESESSFSFPTPPLERNLENIQMEFDSNLKVSVGLERLLRETPRKK